METRDFLLRQIEQLGAVLRRLLAGITGQKHPDGQSISIDATQQALGEVLGLEPGSLPSLLPEELLRLLHANDGASEQNQDLLADILSTMAENAADPQQAQAFRRQALALLEQLNAASDTYDLERHGKVALLRALQ